jgi:hypothetical protein
VRALLGNALDSSPATASVCALVLVEGLAVGMSDSEDEQVLLDEQVRAEMALAA